MMISRHKQRGLTIVELLVGMTVGAIVVGGATAIYTSSVRGSNDTLLAAKLNQELSAALHVMSSDIRRAGFWATAINNRADENPFSTPGATMLTVRDSMVGNAAQPPTGQGSCITYAYDATYLPGNAMGVVENVDLFGFRLNGGVLEMRQVGAVDGAECVGGTCLSCTNGTWQEVTDPDLIQITALNFDLANSQCLNASEPDGLDDNGDGAIDDRDEMNCYMNVPANGSSEVTLESREVTITVNGRLVGDNSVQATMSQTVRVRNDVIRTR